MINILKIEILKKRYGTDMLFLHTDLPSPFLKGVSNAILILKCEVLKNKGEEYVKTNFPDVEYTIIQGA